MNVNVSMEIMEAVKYLHRLYEEGDLHRAGELEESISSQIYNTNVKVNNLEHEVVGLQKELDTKTTQYNSLKFEYRVQEHFLGLEPETHLLKAIYAWVYYNWEHEPKAVIHDSVRAFDGDKIFAASFQLDNDSGPWHTVYGRKVEDGRMYVVREAFPGKDERLPEWTSSTQK